MEFNSLKNNLYRRLRFYTDMCVRHKKQKLEEEAIAFAQGEEFRYFHSQQKRI